MRSPAVHVDRKIPTAADAEQASDPAPAVSALFDSLWDTDDEKSSAQPPKQVAIWKNAGRMPVYFFLWMLVQY